MSTTSRDSRTLSPNYLPSILSHYRKYMPPNPLDNLSPGNDVARTLGEKEFNRNLRRSVVAVSSFVGVWRKIDCSGVLIWLNSSKDEVGVLTTAKVIRCHEKSNRSQYNVIVRTFDGLLFEAEEKYVNFSLNYAILKLNSTHLLKGVTLSQEELPDASSIFVLGRDFFTLSLKQVKGKLLAHPPSFGCDELLSSSCLTYQSSEGGPVVKENGEIIGISYVDEDGFAHVLRAEHIIHNMDVDHVSWFGLTVIDSFNLSHDVRDMLGVFSEEERIVFVKQVFPGSPAEKLQIRPGDRVVNAFGEPVFTTAQYCSYKHLARSALHPLNEISIWSRSCDEIVHVRAECLHVTDRRFCICWPFDESIWRRKPLHGSQTDSLQISWSPVN